MGENLPCIGHLFLGVPVGLDFIFSFIGREGAHVAPDDDDNDDYEVADDATEDNQDEIHNGDPLVHVAAAVANDDPEIVDTVLALVALAEDDYTQSNR